MPASLFSALCGCLLFVNVLADDHSRWHYYSDGVDRWTGPCKGQKQSPIDIVDNKVVFDIMDQLELFNYEGFVEVETENNGHTVILKLNPDDDLYIMGGGLNGSYTLKQIHFHWQSEHTRNGKRSPLEGHFVHVLDKHRNCRSANEEVHSEKYHVLSVMYYLTEKGNDNLSRVISSLKQTAKVGTKNKSIVNIRKLLPENIGEFYRYEGSLTTPNCAETVQWTIFKTGIPISIDQYHVIGDIETMNGTKTINYRPTQNLNNRVVRYVRVRKSYPSVISSSVEIHNAGWILMICILCNFL